MMDVLWVLIAAGPAVLAEVTARKVRSGEWREASLWAAALVLACLYVPISFSAAFMAGMAPGVGRLAVIIPIAGAFFFGRLTFAARHPWNGRFLTLLTVVYALASGGIFVFFRMKGREILNDVITHSSDAGSGYRR